MSIFDSWLHRVATNRGYTKATLDGGILASILGSREQSSVSLLGGQVGTDPKVAIKSSWVFSNVDTVGKLAAESKLMVMRQKPKGGYAPDPDHPFENLFVRPNPFMSKSYLIRYTSMWLQLRGEAAWLLVPDSTGDLVAIWPLPSDRIKPVADSQEYISGYWYKPEGSANKKVWLPPENVCYFREPSIYSYREGMSKLDALEHAIDTDRLASGWNLDTFENDVALRTLISVPSDISRGQFAQVKDEILHQLIAERKRFIIARGGELKAESIGLSHKDMEFLAGREFTREEIDRVFGFPAGFWAKEATEANSRSALNVVINFSVWPQLTMIAEEITAQILTRYYPDEMVIAEFTDIRRDNRDQRLKENNVKFESMTVNEVRAEHGLEPHPDPTYGNVPYTMRRDTRLVALFVPVSTIADGVLHIDEIGNRIRDNRELPGDMPDDTPDEEQDTSEDKAVTKEWERYKSIARRNVKRGVNPSNYEFHSQVLDHDDLLLTRFLLSFANDTKAVDATFHLHEHDHEERKATTEQGKTLQDEINALIVLYVAGDITASEFETRVTELSNRYATEAAIAGYGESELPEAVQDELDALAAANVAAAKRLREAIDKKRDEGGDVTEGLVPFIVGVWSSRPDYIFYTALALNAANPLLTWRRGATYKSCDDCIAFDGTTRRAAEWYLSGYLPGSRSLACGGWQCACTLERE